MHVGELTGVGDGAHVNGVILVFRYEDGFIQAGNKINGKRTGITEAEAENSAVRWFSPEEALAMARAMGKQTLTVIPNGISVIVRES